ncbi:aminopeptidase [Saccharomonospora piscinae]|uniref:Aminopeptidase n=1 Tax=Saccharomonospora piscinae TaxID=687388 RepID=A0A1V9A4Z2_SACPI|nr:neutral zinc metallopeptidase [Saccharomonospora piscinae]OQO92187.1 aminopeptidase [Saccharomonospora piscinae]TLW92126.1 aminopeptidase [Saccharomonospora piscinae]
MTRSGGHGARRTVLTIAVTVVTLAATACSTEIDGEVRSEGDIAGLPVTHFESGLKNNAPTPKLTVDNLSDSDDDRLAVAAIADVSAYWTQQFPRHFDQNFEPVEKLLSYDSTGEEIEVCGATTAAAAMNAFYCPPEDLVAWDRGQLLPLLRQRFGPMAVVTVLGHEFGHAVQYRLGDKAGIDEQTSTIVKEQQADCFTGSYFRWIAEGRSQHFTVSTSEGLNQVMASLFFIRDEPGQSHAAQGAHGTAFDRTYAFQLGFESDAATCAAIDQADVDSRITERPFDPNDAGMGDISIDDRTMGLLQQSLDESFAGAGVPGPKIVNEGGSCPGGVSTPPASYCQDTNTVTIDMAALAELGQPIDREAEFSGQESAAGGLGDFAAFAEVVSRYVQGIQAGLDVPVDNANAGLRTACLVGAWTAAIDVDGAVLRPSPGDLDEAIAELLQPRSLISADINGHPAPNGFARIEALRHGYFDGSSVCSSDYP